MKPILVHCHIYYPELWNELKKCIKNISPYPFKLHITFVEQHPAIVEDVMQTFPAAAIEQVENRGYDIGAFVNIVNQVDLEQYSYVVKIHTKRDMRQGSMLRCFDVSGSRWRNYALDFISTPDKFRHCIQEFEKDVNLGMVSNYRLIFKDEYFGQRVKLECIRLLARLGHKADAYGFVAGSMFMVKAELLKPLQKLRLRLEDFDFPDSDHSSSLAHTIERFVGCLVLAQGKKILDVVSNKQYLGSVIKILLWVKSFMFREKISDSGTRMIKICKILVWKNKE